MSGELREGAWPGRGLRGTRDGRQARRGWGKRGGTRPESPWVGEVRGPRGRPLPHGGRRRAGAPGTGEVRSSPRGARAASPH